MRRSTSSDCPTLNWISRFQRTNSAFAGTDPVSNPVDVLIAGANETAYFRDARLPMLQSLVAQRAASGGASALLSSAVEIFPHQVRAALTVLSDPVQRYLLADEVGLGKTIEAGLVIRQVLLDQPRSRVAVITPDVLRRQWRTELREKFFIDDFPQGQLGDQRSRNA